MPAGSWIFGSTITIITGLTLHWPIERQPNLQQFAAVVAGSDLTHAPVSRLLLETFT